MKKILLITILFAACTSPKYAVRMVVVTQSERGEFQVKPISEWENYHYTGPDTVRQIVAVNRHIRN